MVEPYDIRMELKIIRQSLNHIKYITNYVKRRCPSSRIGRVEWILNDLREFFSWLENEIRDAEAGGKMNLPRRLTAYENILNVVEKYVIQRAECVSVVQNWPLTYTLSSVTSLDEVYEVYEGFADLILQVFNLEGLAQDLTNRPPIVVFGVRRPSQAQTYVKQRIIMMPRQARYRIRFLELVLHEAIHLFASAGEELKLSPNLRKSLINISNTLTELLDKVTPVERRQRICSSLGEELLVEFLKMIIVDKLIDTPPDKGPKVLSINDYVGEYFTTKSFSIWDLLEEYLGIDKKICPTVIDEVKEKVINNLNAILRAQEDDKYRPIWNKLRALIYLIVMPDKIRRDENKRHISTFPASFMYARKILVDDIVNARLSSGWTWEKIIEDMEEYLSSTSFVLALVKLPTKEASENLVEYFNNNVMGRINQALNSIQNGFKSKLLKTYAVTGWFDYLMVIETENVREVALFMDEMLADEVIEDTAVITGKLIPSKSCAQAGNGEKGSCGHALLLIDIVPQPGQNMPYFKQIEAVREELEAVVNGIHGIELARLKIMKNKVFPAVFEIFGKYDIAVILDVRANMNDLMRLISDLKSRLSKKNIVIETQTITGCIIPPKGNPTE